MKVIKDLQNVFREKKKRKKESLFNAAALKQIKAVSDVNSNGRLQQ